MTPLLVLGGGLLGGALTRLATGQQVVVASRHARSHPGLWRHFELGETSLDSLLDGLDRPSVIVALSEDGPDYYSRALPLLMQGLRRLGARVTAVTRPGLGPEDAQATIVELAALFGPGDRCVSPLLPRLRAQRAAYLPRGLPPSRPLFLDDAARAVLHLAQHGPPGARHRLVGPDRLDAATIGSVLTARFGGSVSPMLLRRLPKEDIESLTLAAEGIDTWDDGPFGTRKSFAEWVERLPGPRPRR